MVFDGSCAARDATERFEAAHHSQDAREMMKTYFVGQYIDVRSHVFISTHHYVSSPDVGYLLNWYIE